MALGPGDLLSDRFMIESLAATGGMGLVHRALDRSTGDLVAVKVLRTDLGAVIDDAMRERFLREARVLAQLSHPAIIRYVSHGLTADGSPFLAMEWVEGETLSARLQRGVLGVSEAMVLARRTAEALASAHGVGIIHRDVKPSNLVLVNDEVASVKLIDFGVARVGFGGTDLTRTGFAVGTASYMAPEQARGMADIDGRADLYALGVVLYKSLVGEVPFAGGDLLAVLAKVLLQTAPGIRMRRDDVPQAFEEVIQSLLAKDRDGRPASAEKLLTMLEDVHTGDVDVSSFVPSARFSGDEQRLVSLIAVRPPKLREDQTIAETTAATRTRSPLAAVAERFGARLETLADGGVVAVLLARGSGTDLASSAARLALALRPLVPDSSLAVATGSAEVSGDVPVGEVIERAAELAGNAVDGVRLDDVTAGLLDERFVIVGGALLVGEREASEVARLLLGRPTPCVGREREIGTLLGIAEDCVRDSVSRAVVLTGLPGSGKTRLRHELLRAMGQRWDTASVWMARGDPISAGAHLEMLRQLTRSALGGAITRDAIRARIDKFFSGDELSRITAFLAELLEHKPPQRPSMPPEKTDNVQVGAARRDPMLMGDQMRLAWEDLLRAQCSKALVVLVLDDLQWSDPTTVRWIDSALGQLSDLPLLVLASARPDVDEAFPRLWESRVVTRLRVPPLGKQACELLARHVLGDNASSEVVARIVEQSAGNPFYLEELIRSAVEGDDKPPPTIVAMVQAQLEKLDPIARSVLRAASVFGRTFRRDALDQLLPDEPEIEGALARLIEREMIRRRPGSPTEMQELTFRHALVREAAYASLTSTDRKAAHKIAGRWLEKAGGASPLVLAEHLERGGDLPRAASALLRAAMQSIEGNDFGSAMDRARKALGFGLAGDEAANAHRIIAEAHRWRGEAEDAWNEASEALRLATPHGAMWIRTIEELAHAGFRTSRLPELIEMTSGLDSSPSPTADPALAGVRLHTLATLARVFSSLTDRAVLDRVLERIDNELALLGDPPPELVADIAVSHAMRALTMRDYEQTLAHTMRRRRALLQVGNLRAACEASNTLGFVNLSLGAHAAAEAALREGVEMAKRVGVPRELAQCSANLALVYGRTGRLEQGLDLAKQALESFRALGEGPLLASSLLDVAILTWEAGDTAMAEAYAIGGVKMADTSHPTLAIYSRAWLSRFLLGRAAEEALRLSEDAYKRRDAIIVHDPGDAIVDLAYAEALEAVGRSVEARLVVERAKESLTAQARNIQDEELRRGFLESVPENKAILALARWLSSR